MDHKLKQIVRPNQSDKANKMRRPPTKRKAIVAQYGKANRVKINPKMVSLEIK